MGGRKGSRGILSVFRLHPFSFILSLLASFFSTSTPRSSVASLAAYETRKCVSLRLKMLPGMISN